LFDEVEDRAAAADSGDDSSDDGGLVDIAPKKRTAVTRGGRK
jgi:hypothetical protein